MISIVSIVLNNNYIPRPAIYLAWFWLELHIILMFFCFERLSDIHYSQVFTCTLQLNMGVQGLDQPRFVAFSHAFPSPPVPVPVA
jgi:hypothetical protein